MRAQPPACCRCCDNATRARATQASFLARGHDLEGTWCAHPENLCSCPHHDPSERCSCVQAGGRRACSPATSERLTYAGRPTTQEVSTMDAQMTAARSDELAQDRKPNAGQVAHEHLFEQLAMLEDVVQSLVSELDKVLNPHDTAGDGDCQADEPAPAVSLMTADLERAASRLESLRSTLQSVRRRLEV